VSSAPKPSVSETATLGSVQYPTAAKGARSYRYYDLLLGGFAMVLLCSNLIGPGKTCQMPIPLIGTAIVFGAGNIFFPISYIFGDVLTEVYGYARARRAIWVGFAGLVFAALMSFVIVKLPPAATEPFNVRLQGALELAFGNTWRVVVASIGAFWAGDFVNSYVLVKLKVYSRGRLLWTRTIGLIVVG
jgi:queuosine precursor transporter